MKASGWIRYRSLSYRADNRKLADRRRDKVDPGTIATQQDLKAFVASPSGPVSYSLSQASYLETDPDGNVRVKPDKVREAAKQYVADARVNIDTADEEPDPRYRVEQIKNGFWWEDDITDREAINVINRAEAADAQALLVAARVAKVRLTDSQRERLEAIANGQYYNLLVGRYREAERRKRSAEFNEYGRIGKYNRDRRGDAQKAEDRERFLEMNQSAVAYQNRDSYISYGDFR